LENRLLPVRTSGGAQTQDEPVSFILEETMRAPSVGLAAIVLATCVSAACSKSGPAAPSATPAAPAAGGSEAAPLAASWGPEQPPFNLEAVLRPVGGTTTGFGLVKFRQSNDESKIVNLDVWVRDLLPNTSYSLQRAVDTTIDGTCTSTAWLTLGQGLQAYAITTDATGTGRAPLFRDLAAVALGSRFDIYFQIVPTGSTTPVLQSECYEFVVSQ
jgi:hypothetical protein